MNILHMKYAVEVARVGSLNKASETLLIAQPNISRSVKELENDLGITIFERTAKGMLPTPEGEEFLEYAKGILKQIEQVENMYKNGAAKKQHFSISVPRANYISAAFANFSKKIGESPAEIFYKETNSQRVISNILENDYKLGILRYSENYDKYFKALIEEKGLESELISEFSYLLITSADSKLAKLDNPTLADLKDYIEIAHADPYVPSLPMSKVVKEELPADVGRRIFVFERASQYDLLSENPDTYMWVSPASEQTLSRYNLVQKKCPENKKIYKDVLVYKNGYKLTKLDKLFITELCGAKRKYL